MLTVIVPGDEVFDEENQRFLKPNDFTLELEHSLVSLSKWESEFEKPFLESAKDRTPEELLGYVKHMTLTPGVPDDVYLRLSEENIRDIMAYIEAKMTATWFSEPPGAPRSREIVTAEVVYYWMTVFHIPFECENWHLNRLFTLIRVCNLKQAKPQTMSRAEAAQRQRELNEQRKKMYNTTG
jgi:hypothetical protein